MTYQVPESLAAVDLGSNSFHMVVARVVGGEPVIVDRLREHVQLAAGLDEDKEISDEAWQRALECLGRFGQRIREFPAIAVRAVATNTMRDVRDGRHLLEDAEAALGYPVEIISGNEEARLIYLGVSHTLAEEFDRRLVVDIGGGSTECILGERFEPVLVDSLEMGCVGYSRQFFPDGAITPGRFEDAVLAILAAVFDGLEIARMEAASGALREGVLFDLLGRYQHEDARDRTIALFQKRYHVDEEQAARVERTALELLGQVAGPWQLEVEEAGRFLSWAARLHEIGLVVAYGGHHRHGAYLVANSEMPGFSRDNQNLVATLIRAHRRKIRESYFRDLPRRQRHLAKRLAVLLRLAVRFNRGRSTEPLPDIRLAVPAKDTLEVVLPEGWLEKHPLTRTDLAVEAQRVSAIGLTLEVEGYTAGQ